MSQLQPKIDGSLKLLSASKDNTMPDNAKEKADAVQLVDKLFPGLNRRTRAKEDERRDERLGDIPNFLQINDDGGFDRLCATFEYFGRINVDKDVSLSNKKDLLPNKPFDNLQTKNSLWDDVYTTGDLSESETNESEDEKRDEDDNSDDEDDNSDAEQEQQCPYRLRNRKNIEKSDKSDNDQEDEDDNSDEEQENQRPYYFRKRKIVQNAFNQSEKVDFQKKSTNSKKHTSGKTNCLHQSIDAFNNEKAKRAQELSQAYASELIAELRNELVVMRSKINDKPINEKVAERAIAQINRLCLQYMLLEQTQISPTKKQKQKPNQNSLVLVKDKDLNRNKRIILGFNLAQGFPRITYKTSFLDCFKETCVCSLPLSQLMQSLQSFADQTYKIYRLFVFSSDNDRIPAWTGKRIDSHKRAIGVYLTDNKVYGVTDVSRLFGSKYEIYCPDCHTCFHKSRPDEHRRKCPLRCPNCCMYGYDYPCDTGFVEKICDRCNRVFDNVRCFENHKLISCDRVKRCPNCADTYVLYGKSDKHKCKVKRCGWCQKNHARGSKCLY